jgi:hypothetical protein
MFAMGPLMVTASQKLIGQVLFIAAGIICLKMGERDVAMGLIFSALGSVVPVAESSKKEPK